MPQQLFFLLLPLGDADGRPSLLLRESKMMNLKGQILFSFLPQTHVNKFPECFELTLFLNKDKIDLSLSAVLGLMKAYVIIGQVFQFTFNSEREKQ